MYNGNRNRLGKQNVLGKKDGLNGNREQLIV